MSWAYQLTDGWLCGRLARTEALEDGAKKDAAPKWKPFQPKGTPARYSRDRVVDVRHIRLEVKLDVEAKRIAATARLDVRPIAGEVRSLELDAVALEVRRVRCGGRTVPFTNTGQKLILHFDPPLLPDQDAAIAVQYRAAPRRGLYFVGPDRRDPKKHAEVWSQGQDEDNRHWFPCFDYPCEKATSELIATVPGTWFCLSNGRLLSRRERKDGSAVFHWIQEVPHVSYLITLCAGRYAEVRDEWDGIPVNYYVPPGREADGERAFGKTPRMVEFFSKRIGVRYPFAKYAQITAADFIFGGMENTSATTQTQRTLHDARAHLDFSSEPLVAHELVHSWFGNLLTCRDWSHAWLNESFATYFDNLWYQHERGEDEFRYEMYADLRAYLAEDKERYRRPIVTNVYRAPLDLFDRHLYQKGATILHHLRTILGERLFFKAIEHYTRRFAERTVITQDLATAIEETSGRNFDWFFEQWIYKGGHPEFEVAGAWDEKTKALALTLRQKQPPDKLTSIFRVPLKVRFVGQGYDETRSFEVREARHVFHAVLAGRPKWIAFDPGNTVPKTAELKFDEDQLIAQLAEDDDVMGRIYAAQELVRRGTPQAVEALGKRLRKDAFWGVRAECAAGLGKVHTSGALAELLGAARVSHPKVRRAVARALGAWRGEKAVPALRRMAAKDKSYFVEASAAEALGQTRSKSAWKELVKLTRRSSWSEVVRVGALRGLVELDAERACGVLEAFSRIGQPEQARLAAIGLWGRAARESNKEELKKRARRVLEKILETGFFFDRGAAIRALRELRDPAAIEALARFKDSGLDRRLVRAAEKAIEALHAAEGVPPELKALREELDKLKEESRKLKEQVAKLERVGAAGKKAERRKRAPAKGRKRRT